MKTQTRSNSRIASPKAARTPGKKSWSAAKREGEESPLLTTPDQIEALRSYVKDFGAWDAEEIAGWSDVECNALFIQLVSGDLREAGLDQDPSDDDWAAYEADDNQAHNVFKASDGKVYFSLSN